MSDDELLAIAPVARAPEQPVLLQGREERLHAGVERRQLPER